MGFSSGKISVENVDLDSSQTLENKTLDASNDFSGDIITPSRSDVKQDTQANLETYALTATNGQHVFATDTKQMYQIVDNALAPVGGGSGGLDVFYAETFEGAVKSANFTSGNDADFDNGGTLAGTLSDETVSPLSKTTSLKYVQAAGSLNDFVKSPLIKIDKKQQGQTVGLELYYTYSGDSDDIKIIGYDDTGAEIMTLASDLIKQSTSSQRLSVQFPVPSSSSNIAYGIQVVTENIGAELIIDDVQISTNPYVSKDLLESEQVIKAEGNGGTSITANVTDIDFTEVNDDLGLWNGTTFTAISEGYYTLTTSVHVSTTPSTWSLILYKNGSEERRLNYDQIADGTVLTGNAIIHLDKGDYVSIRSSDTVTLVDDSVWHWLQIIKTPKATEHIIAYNSRNAENSMVRLHTGNGHGSTNNKIRRFSTEVSNIGSAITYTDSATDGASFTINEDGVYFISYDDGVSSGNARLGVSLNSTQLTTDISSITAANRLTQTVSVTSFETTTSWSGKLSKGDVIRPHTGGANNEGVLAQFTISKIGVGDLLGVPKPRTAYIKDVKPSGTAGGTFTSGAWQTRDLNTLEGDTEFVSLSSNQVTLQSGKYRIRALAPAYNVNNHKAKLRNITDSTDDIMGMLSYTPAAAGHDVQNNSVIEGVIEITSSKTFEIQHYGAMTAASNGFGISFVGTGTDEVYTTLVIEKIA